MKSLVISAKHFKPKETTAYNKIKCIKNNIVLIFLCISFLLGISTGAASTNIADMSTLEILDFLFLTNFHTRLEQSVLYTFSATLSSSFVFLLSVFLLGVSLWGFIVIPVITFFKGYGLGVSLGYLYGVYKFKGILFNILVMLPGAIIISAAVILFSKLSMTFSFKLSKNIFSRKTGSQIAIKKYLVKFAWFLVIIAVGSAIDMLFTVIFSGLFSF